jgi:predicted nucleic acid-binding protein
MPFLVDTNIFLDVVLAREGLEEESRQVLNWFGNHPGEGWVAWHTLANLSYVGTRMAGPASAMKALREILEVFEVCRVGTQEAHRALHLRLRDFEDSLQVSAGLAAGVAAIVTRNLKDFRGSPLPALSPRAFLSKRDEI